MNYPHKEDLMNVLNHNISFEEFLNSFTKISSFEKEHPVFNMISYVKEILEKNSKEMIDGKIEGGTLCSAINIKLDEVYNDMKVYSENCSRMGEKDGYDLDELNDGYHFSKKLIDEICYAYSEDY